jgi:hypothetical protein
MLLLLMWLTLLDTVHTAFPRIVKHVDESFLVQVTQLYRERIKPGGQAPPNRYHFTAVQACWPVEVFPVSIVLEESPGGLSHGWLVAILSKQLLWHGLVEFCVAEGSVC